MSSGRKRFKILTQRLTSGTWVSSLGVPRAYNCPEYVIKAWCPTRKRFRDKDTLAVGIPYPWSETRPRIPWWRSPSKMTVHPYVDAIDSFGSQLATQNGLPWIRNFNPSWKMQDLLLLRLKGKI